MADEAVDAEDQDAFHWRAVTGEPRILPRRGSGPAHGDSPVPLRRAMRSIVRSTWRGKKCMTSIRKYMLSPARALTNVTAVAATGIIANSTSRRRMNATTAGVSDSSGELRTTAQVVDVGDQRDGEQQLDEPVEHDRDRQQLVGDHHVAAAAASPVPRPQYARAQYARRAPEWVVAPGYGGATARTRS